MDSPFPFPTRSVLAHREDYLDWLSGHSFDPDHFFCVVPLPDDLFRLIFREGEVPSTLDDEDEPLEESAP